ENVRKYLLPVSLTAAAVFLVAGRLQSKPEADCARETTYNWSQMQDIYEEEDELDERVRMVAVYREQLGRIKRDLLRAGLSLEAAVDDTAAIVSETRPRLITT